MKKTNTLVALSFIALLLTSCAGRVGYHAASETFRSSSGAIAIAPHISKSSSQSKASASSSNSSVLSASNTTSKSGFFAGIYFTDIEIADKLEVQPEVDIIIVSDFNQIQVPVLLKYDVAEKFDVLAGPNVGYILDAPNGLKSLNFSIDFGAAYDFAEKFNVNARYGIGLTNLLENAGGSSSKLSGFQIGVGYKF